MLTLTYTYEVTTPESAEHGFWAPGDWRYPIGGRKVDSSRLVALEDCPKPDEYRDIAGTRDALESALSGFEGHEHQRFNNGEDNLILTGYTTNDYRTGADVTISAHIKGPAQQIRQLMDLLCIKPAVFEKLNT